MPRLRLILAFGLIALLAVPTIASARPDQRGFKQTFPHASVLCQKVTNGKTPKGLKGSTDKVAAACAKLRSDFTDAQNAWTTGVAPLKQQATDAIKTLRATCRQARADKNPAACKAARLSTRTTIQGLRSQIRQLTTTYRTSVQTARKTFWDTIRALRGGSSVTPDTSVGPAPTVTLPSDSQVTG